jgi:sulfopropanediol 3-dehydrogenase
MIRRIKTGLSAETKAENSVQVRNTVEGILGDIASRGGAAVREFSEKFDQWSPPQFRLSADEIADCVRALPASTIEDIKFAQTQIRNFAVAQRNCLKDLEIETLPGVVLLVNALRAMMADIARFDFPGTCKPRIVQHRHPAPQW